ncbi:MAG TPA: panthothenate synthetase [Vicinamibacteria bacterium]|nr:panthothenate synthetase [Vicinamibacteria bacterium]
MRMLIDFQMPLEPFNTLVKNGTAGPTIERVLGEIKPEAVYFTAREGKRGGTMVVDVANASKIPSIAEPLFLAFDATVRFHPCMTPDDLAKAGLEELGKKYK